MTVQTKTKKPKRKPKAKTSGRKESPKAGRKSTRFSKAELAAKSRKNRERSSAFAAKVTLAGQELKGSKIGDLIEAGPKDPARRAEALSSLRRFCEIYASKVFSKPWAPFHIEAIKKIEDAVNFGAWFAFAFPRGDGKSSLCHWGALWGSMRGAIPYAMTIGATALAASRRLGNQKKTLRFNDLLLEDFPEVCGPIRHIAGEPRKATGQKWDGKSTGIEWSDRIVLADIPVDYAVSPNFVIDSASIDGEIRGRLYENQRGESIRPSFVLCDDPQTRETARSSAGCDYRESVLKGDIRYLAASGERIGLVIPCTVIYQDDLADRLLDRKRNPEFKGTRAKMLESLPTRVDLWEQYGEIRKQSFRDGGLGEPALEFYRANRDAMDQGAVPSWPERFGESDVSAIQFAMDLKLTDEASFYAEAQNEPIVATDQDETPLRPADVESRELGIPWGMVPDGTEKISGFIDISEKVLWYVLTAWQRDGTGVVFRYGAWPDQGLNFFTLSSVRRTIQQRAKGQSYLAALLSGLEALVEQLVGAEYKSETGEVFSVEVLGIDSGWGEYAHDVYRFCRRSKYRSALRPMKGVGITATKRPLVDPQSKPKSRESVEGQWKFTATKAGIPLLQFDTNLWKSRINSALRIDKSSSGSLSLTKPETGRTHRLIGEQATAERGKKVSASGRTVTQWELIPGRDNHLLDGLVGSAVVANTVGVRFELGFSTKKKTRADSIEEKPESGKPAAKKKKSRRPAEFIY